MYQTWTIDTIIEACGGTVAVSAALSLTDGAVSKMRRNGINDRHWRVLIAMGGGAFGPVDLYHANEMTRGEASRDEDAA